MARRMKTEREQKLTDYCRALTDWLSLVGKDYSWVLDSYSRQLDQAVWMLEKARDDVPLSVAEQHKSLPPMVNEVI